MFEILIQLATVAIQATVVLTMPVGLVLLTVGVIHPIAETL